VVALAAAAWLALDRALSTQPLPGAAAAPVHAQDLDARRAQQDLAEGAHPIARVLARAAAAVAQSLELVEAGQLHLELQRRPALAARERHEAGGRSAPRPARPPPRAG
jgi:hypothetical protein